MNRFVFFPLLVILFIGMAPSVQPKSGPENSWTAVSPEGSLKIILLKASGSLRYAVLINGDTAIRESALGLTFSDESFNNGLAFVRAEDSSIDDHYQMVTGKRKKNEAKANQVTVTFKNKIDRRIQLVLRAYNDGVAFRYRFPDAKEKDTVTEESTAFSIPLHGKAWLQSYSLPADWAPSYENMYSNGTPIGENARDSSGYSFAALFQSKNNWLLLTEAGLDENFYGSHLQEHCENGIYRIARPQSGEARGLYSPFAITSGPFATPWRVIITGKSLKTIFESNLVNHLSDPNRIGDVSWVKPGRSSWSWWSDHKSSRDFNSLKKYIDLSKEMGWEYSLVDANWDLMQGGNIEQLANYAKTLGVRLSLWYNSAGPHSKITERPRDIMSDPQKRKEELKKIRAWGIAAIKVDFFNSDKQELIKLYQDILKDAAAEHIMVLFHGCTLQRGWARTWPNLVTMEGVHGAEQYTWDKKFSAESPAQNIIYGLTRNVVGSMDYTPVTFSSYPCCRHSTTNAYELALSVLFESGIIHFADGAGNYEKTDANIHEFLRKVPSTWDDSRFIQGYPGKELVIARRSGDDWYVAAANGEDMEKP
ncbi:MAG TPA: glycoside hydrolase family 97 catalytic domain-containing protein, partial [Puia sp.]